MTIKTMYIYNVTINVEEIIHDQWLDWMQQEYIPAMLATGKFSKALLTKVIVEEEMGGVTYSVQYTTDSKATLQRYEQEDAEQLYQKSNRFAGQFLSFTTELKTISEQEA